MGKHVHYQVQYCIRNYSYLNGQSLMYESVLMIDDIDLVAKLFEKVNHSPHYGNISVFFLSLNSGRMFHREGLSNFTSTKS
jgi:hypothetical protein